jgi:tetratricopeptide (TPR) repeat protein
VPEVDSSALRRHVVRVEEPDGKKILGTGFFVAPGWVLTCAHVVKEHETVALSPGGIGVSFPAVVAGRSAAPPPGWASGIWPFPDLALLKYSSAQGSFPSVLLDTCEPDGGRDCYTWGFPRREDVVDPVGSAVSVGYQGIDGDGYYSLRSGLVHPGLSGAPLVCPVRRAVVGVVAATRDPHGALAGWASPVAALRAGEAVLPPDLAAAGEEVLRLNRETVLSDRMVWHAVLPLPDCSAGVEETWQPFVRAPKSLPSQLLLAEHLVVPYMFRDSDLEQVRAWCEGPEAMALTQVAGGGGAGKTRFAIECCRRMSDLGWVAGFLRDPSAATVPWPRLVVIDYAETVPDLAEQLKALRRSATDIAPVRVLLLTRTMAGTNNPLGSLRGEATLQYLIDASKDADAASRLDQEQRRTLHQKATARFAQAWNARNVDNLPGSDLSPAHFGAPLEVLVHALNTVLAQDPPNPGPGTDPWRVPLGGLELLLAHEERYWAPTAPPALDEQTQRDAVALATLANAASEADAHAVLELLEDLAGDKGVAERRRTIAWLATLYQGQDLLNPLRPDRLGEALIISSLNHRGDQGQALLAGVLSLESDQQVIRCLEVVARIASSSPPMRAPMAAALLNHYQDLVDRCTQASQGSTDHPGSADLAIALAQAHDRLVQGQYIDTLPDAVRAALSSDMDRIGGLLEAWGQPELATHLYRQALTIDQDLASREPRNTGYQRALSISYNKLGDLAQAEGQPDQARTLHQQGLDIAERLAHGEPGNTAYQRDLSISYNKLGNLAQAEGQPDQARTLYQQALDIAERLAHGEPGNTAYQRDLSVSYERLGNLAQAEGQPDQARTLHQQGLDIAERLAHGEPGNTAYQRDLSVSYNKLGDLAQTEGQPGQARTLYQQGLDIRARLAHGEPGNTAYQRDLSVSYNKLGDLALAEGQPGQARTLYQQGLDIRVRLTHGEPGNTAYQRDLSVSYERLGDLALAEGQHGQAADLFRFAVATRRSLSSQEPKRLDLVEELGVSLHLLASVLTDDQAHHIRVEARAALAPFQAADALTRKGLAVLAWAEPQ